VTPDVELKVNGRVFSGWQSVSIERSIDSLAGGFSLAVSDRWNGQEKPWQIVEGDECTLSANGQIVITGYVDQRSISYGSEEHTLEVSGRDKAADLVDCSAILDTWEFAAQRVDKIVSAVAAPFGISVKTAPGFAVPSAREKFAVNHGETVYEVIERACRLGGVLTMSDGRGGLIVTRTPAGRATTALVEGKNIKSASGSYDTAERFARYVVAAQSAGTDSAFGADVAQVQAVARDANVRAARALLIRGEGNMTLGQAQERANWEATVRAARAGTASVVVQGWTQESGALWPLNVLVPVRSPFLGIDSDMLISGTHITLDDAGGSITEITLARPDAFTPEPFIPKGSDPQSVGDIFG